MKSVKPLGVKRWVILTVIGTILLLVLLLVGSHEMIAYDVRTAKDAKGYTIDNVINEKMFFGHKGKYDYHVRGILTHDVVVDGCSPDGEDSGWVEMNFRHYPDDSWRCVRIEARLGSQRVVQTNKDFLTRNFTYYVHHIL